MENEIYKKSIELAPFGFAYHQIVTDPDGKAVDYIFLEVNASFEKLTGALAKDIIGKRITEVMPAIKEDPFNWIEYYGSIALKGGDKVFEQYSSAQNRWYKVHVYSPQLNYFITTFIDITKERKQSEQIENFFKVSLDLLCIADLEGNFLRLNPSWKEVLGHSEEDLLGHKFFDFIHPDDMSATLFAMSELKNKIKVINFVNRYRCKDGSYRYIEWRSHPHDDFIYAAARDITENKKAEQALRESEEKFRNLVWDMSAGVLLQGPKAEMILSNPHALELLGLTEDQLLGKSSFDPYWNVIHEDGSPFPGETHPVPLAIATRRAVRGVVMGVYRPLKGDRVWLQVDAIPELNSDGSVRQVVCTFIDITARKQAEESLQEKSELLTLFVKNSPIYCFIKEVTENRSYVLHASENYKEMVGIAGSKMVGKTMEELFPLELANAMTADDWKVVTKGAVLRVDEELNGRAYTSIKFPIKQGTKTLLAGYTIDLTDRKKAEEELSKQNSLFTSLLQNLPLGVFMVEAPSGKPLVANEAAFELLGRGILPDTSASNLAAVYKAYKSGSNITYPPEEMPILLGMQGRSTHIDDLVVERPDGSRKLLEIFGSPVMDEHGKVWASLVSFFDISDRKKIEFELKKTKAILQAAMDHTPAGIVIADAPSGQITYINDAGLFLQGGDRDRLTKKEFGLIEYETSGQLLDVNGKRYLTAEEIPLLRAIKFGETNTLEFTVRSEQNTDRIVLGQAAPIKNEDGEITSGIVVFLDITDRKKIEEEFRKEKKKVEKYLDVAEVMLVAIDDQERITLINRKGCKILGFSEGELVGKNWFEMCISCENISEAKLAYHNLIAGKLKSSEYFENYVITKKGEKKLIAWHNTYLVNDEGKISGILSSGEDITEKREAQNKLARYQDDLEQTVELRTKELKETNERLQEFAHVVSHDMKGPLRGISTLVSFINEEKDRLSEKQIEYFFNIQTRVRRLYSQIEAILYYSSIVGDGTEVDVVNTNEVIDEVLEMLEPPKTFLFEVSQLPVIHFSRQKIYQIFQNLIGNAIKFSPQDGTVTIWHEEREDFLQIFIKDTGEGIDPKYFEKIFGLFQTLHPRDEIDGTGVGLPIVKKLVESCGGKVFVDSSLGNGATFSFTIRK